MKETPSSTGLHTSKPLEISYKFSLEIKTTQNPLCESLTSFESLQPTPASLFAAIFNARKQQLVQVLSNLSAIWSEAIIV